MDTGNSLHVQTVSTAGSVDILRRCKRKTAGLSAEAALHHLLFTHEDVGRYDTCYKHSKKKKIRLASAMLIWGASASLVNLQKPKTTVMEGSRR